jgi:hypothetical protein
VAVDAPPVVRAVLFAAPPPDELHAPSPRVAAVIAAPSQMILLDRLVVTSSSSLSRSATFGAKINSVDRIILDCVVGAENRCMDARSPWEKCQGSLLSVHRGPGGIGRLVAATNYDSFYRIYGTRRAVLYQQP